MSSWAPKNYTFTTGENIDPITQTKVEDMQLAEIEILRIVQRDYFKVELATLSSSDKNKNTQKKLKKHTHCSDLIPS